MLFIGFITINLVWCWIKNEVTYEYSIDWDKVFINPEFVAKYRNSDVKDMHIEGGYDKIPLEWADYKTFKDLWNWYWNDVNKVYFLTQEIKWADKNTFERLWNAWFCYSRDKNNYYFVWRLMEWVDYKTFKVLINLMDDKYKDCYSKDKNMVYIGGRKFEWVDPNTFVVFGD